MKTIPSTTTIRRALFVAVAFIISSLHAQTITLPNDLKVGITAYKGVIYARHDAAYVTFYHASGVAHVEISSLAPDVQKTLGYDPQLAEQQLEREQQRQLTTPPAPTVPAEAIHGVLLGKTDKGLLIATRKATGEKKQVSEWNADSTRLEESRSDIENTVFYLVRENPNAEYLRDGAKIDYLVQPTGSDYSRGNPAITAKFIRTLD